MTDLPTKDAVETARDYDPFNMDSPSEAHQAYGELRKCPVQHSSGGGGFYWLTRYDDVRAAALDSDRFSSGRKGVQLPPTVDSPRLHLLEMDPPEHGVWRRIFMEALAPDRLRRVEPKLHAIANGLIDQFAGAGECDLMEQFAGPLPVLGVCATLGVSEVSVDHIHEVSSRFGSDPETTQEVVRILGDILLKEVLDRRETPRDDYLTYVGNVEIDGRRLTEEEIGPFLFAFLVAGHETTTSSLGSLMAHVLPDMALRERLLTDDRALAGAVEEAVRMHPPFHAFHRTTTEDVDIGGATIPADCTVRLSWAAANYDPGAFERPEEFNPDRRPNAHVGFGFGRHMCVGAPLARLEMRIALRTLLQRLPDIQLVDDVEWKLLGHLLERPAAYRAKFTPT